MKKIRVLFLLITFLIPFLTLNAQDEVPTIDYRQTDPTGFYLGGHASTNGWGLNAKYTLNKWFSIKTGYESLSLSLDFEFSEYEIDYLANLDYKTGGIFLMGDFNYTRHLYISAGAVFNSFNPKMDGHAVSDLKFGDIYIPAEDIGTFSFDIEPGLKVAPYVGAGVNSYIGKAKRLVFNFETGIYYMGSPDLKIDADGLLAPTADEAHGQEVYLEKQLDAYKIYPVMKLNLAYRIF